MFSFIISGQRSRFFFTLAVSFTLSIFPQWVAGQGDYSTPEAAIAGVDLPNRALVVHYHNPDEQYENVGLWTWDLTGVSTPPESEQEVFPAGRSDYGALFVIDLDLYGAAGQGDQIGLLPRFDKDWGKKDGSDRAWNEPASGSSPWQAWLIKGDPNTYQERPSLDVRPLRALIDSPTKITVSFSYPLSGEEIDAANPVLRWGDESGSSVDISALQADSSGNKIQYLRISEPIEDITRDYFVEFEGMDSVLALPRDILNDPEKYFAPDAELGAHYSATGTKFAVFAPTARKVSVVLYDEVEGSAGRREVPLVKGSKGVWSVDISGDLKNKFYMYQLEGPGMAFSDEAIDPYALATPTGSVGTAERGMIVSWEDLTPEGHYDIPRPPLEDENNTVIYEVHVRDFTQHADAGITNRGKFLGLTEKDTHLKGDPAIKTGLAHFQELGVTHLQLLPIQNFDNDERKGEYNWGYMPSYFNAPEGWYATDRSTNSGISEFMQLVGTMHEAGLRVIMDVVYNHTDNSAEFDKFVPFYYYRTDDSGNKTNGSGTGNEFKSENPMARKFIHDSCSMWVERYRVDGFRFDLMGLIDAETMVKLDEKLKKIDPTVQVWGEPWGAGALPDNAANFDGIRGTDIAAFNDRFRDLIKGSTFDEAGRGYIQGATNVWELNGQMRGGWPQPASQPTEVLQYCEAHDNHTLWDKLELSAPERTEENRRHMQMLAGAILMTSQGKIFLHGGQDFCRTKDGEHNSYNAPDPVNVIDYARKKEFFEVFEYYRELIAFRKAHPVFHLTTREEATSRMRFPTNHMVNNKMTVAWLNGRGLEAEPWKEILVVHYAGTTPVEFNLPERNFMSTLNDLGPWKTLLLNHEFSATGDNTAARLTMQPVSSAIFYREK